MNSMRELLGNLFRDRPLAEDEYVNEQDGLVYCRNCHTPRQTAIRASDGSIVFCPPVMCDCKRAERDVEDVDKCIDRILDLGGEVKNEAKKESPVCADPVEWIKCDLQASREGLAALAPLVEMVQRDPSTFEILVAYYKDEEEDLLWGEQQLALIEAIGHQNWLVQQL